MGLTENKTNFAKTRIQFTLSHFCVRNDLDSAHHENDREACNALSKFKVSLPL